MVASGGVEEMFVYVGFAEEFTLQTPTLPDDKGHVKSCALLGYRFKRAKLGGLMQLCWRQGGETAKALEKDASAMTLSAVKVTRSSKIYIVDGDVSDIFGGKLMTMFREVLSSSSLFEAHREHQLLVGNDPLSTLRRMYRGTLALKAEDDLEKLVTGVYATLLYGVAGTFSKAFEALAKASKSQQTETTTEFIKAMTNHKLFLRKHLLWMLRRVPAQRLKGLMTKAEGHLGELEAAARARLKMPATAKALLQDEIRGGREVDQEGEGRQRKKTGGEKTTSPTKNAGDTASASARAIKKKPRGQQSLDALLQTPADGATELARQLQASLSKMPSPQEVDDLRSQAGGLKERVSTLEGEKATLAASLSTETLRANSEHTRAEQEKTRADGLQHELTELRKRLDASSIQTQGSSKESPEVTALREEISFLRNQVMVLTMLTGGNKEAATDLAKNAAGAPKATR